MSQHHADRGDLFEHPSVIQGMFKERHIFPDNATTALNGVLAEMSLDAMARTRALAIRRSRELKGILRPILCAEVSP